MTVAVRKRGKGYDYFINVPFRNCKVKVNDFKKRGLMETEQNLKSYENNYFCPEFDKY